MPMGVVRTQGLELFALQWFREVAGQAKGMAGATLEMANNLCKLVTQENQWARVYTGCVAKVLEEKIGQEEEEKKEEEEEEEEAEEAEEEMVEESPLVWPV